MCGYVGSIRSRRRNTAASPCGASHQRPANRVFTPLAGHRSRDPACVPRSWYRRDHLRRALAWSSQRTLVCSTALEPSDFRAHQPRFAAGNLAHNLALVEALRAIAVAKGATVAQIAIAWVLSRGQDIVPLIGARRRDRLAEALGAVEFDLTEDDLARYRARSTARCSGGRTLRREGDDRARQRAWGSGDTVSEGTLTPERILVAAEEVLRRYGPAKTTVVDVARTLGVSHGSVYRHFPTKLALRDAVAERWLARVSEPLAIVAAEPGPAPERLIRWLDLLVALQAQPCACRS